MAGFAAPQLNDARNKGRDAARTAIPSSPSPTSRTAPVLAQPTRSGLRSRRISAIATLAVAVVAAVAIWFVTSRDPSRAPSSARPQSAAPSSTVSPGADRATAQAVRWIKDNVARDTSVFAPSAALAGLRGADLRGAGVRGAGGLAIAALPKPGTALQAGYLLSTPALRAAGSRSAAAVLAASVPIAQFGDGATRAEVRQLSPDGVASLRQRRTQELHYRRLAGNELLHNPNVQVSVRARDQIARGDLDLRAETLLAVAADSTPVHVLVIRDDPAEHGFGMPARTLVVSVGRAAPVSSAVLRLPSASRPTVTSLSSNQLQLGWQLSLAALQPLQ